MVATQAWAFSEVAPRLWIALLSETHLAPSLHSFNREAKTFLFSQALGNVSFFEEINMKSHQEECHLPSSFHPSNFTAKMLYLFQNTLLNGYTSPPEPEPPKKLAAFFASTKIHIYFRTYTIAKFYQYILYNPKYNSQGKEKCNIQIKHNKEMHTKRGSCKL
ncbi:Hypothetical predicted protein [Podarcis lilfordi]|uniref:Uncharacterized protein n=1 Tax=Podarcis lilfordi TaxID=74358 RepID=A0AA35K8W5_9SAUR|nr:Hypothetical predicted protein [Podarcis lilfordi]